MLGPILFFILMALAVTFQISFLPEIFPSGAVPDLIVVIVIYWAMKEDFINVLPKAIFLGLLYDFFSFYPVGANIISLSAVAFMINSFTKRLALSQRGWKIGIIALLVVFGTITNDLILWIISEMSRYALREQFYMTGDFFSLRLIIETALNILLFIIIQPIAMRFEKIARLYFGKKMAIK